MCLCCQAICAFVQRLYRRILYQNIFPSELSTQHTPCRISLSGYSSGFVARSEVINTIVTALAFKWKSIGSLFRGFIGFLLARYISFLAPLWHCKAAKTDKYFFLPELIWLCWYPLRGCGRQGSASDRGWWPGPRTRLECWHQTDSSGNQPHWKYSVLVDPWSNGLSEGYLTVIS